MHKVTFSGSEVTVAGRTWRVPFPVAQAVLAGDRVLVLYDYMTGPRHRQFQNLEAFTLEGVRLWTAEHPTSTTADVYVSITSVSPLRVSSFASYDCTLDEESGRLLRSEFTK
jgi:hypothetical protein